MLKSPEEIKKGLECCNTVGANCDDCPYDGECMLPFGNNPERDALAYIEQLERREWELFERLSSAWFGKQCYFKQDDGTVYSRQSCKYLTFDQAIEEFEEMLVSTNETAEEGGLK